MMNGIIEQIKNLIDDFRINDLDGIRGLLSNILSSDGKVFVIGNKKASVIAGEFSEYASLNSNLNFFSMSEGSVLTCLSNDFGFDAIYEKYVDEYASSGDLIIALKSAGEEENIHRALKKAKEKGCNVICLSGIDFEDDLPEYTDIHIVIPSDNDRIIYLCEEIILETVFDEIKNNNKG